MSDLGQNQPILSRKWHFDRIWRGSFSKMGCAASDAPSIFLFVLVRLRKLVIEFELPGRIPDEVMRDIVFNSLNFMMDSITT